MAHAHNVFFQFLVDVGIFGLVSYLVWIWFWLRESWINPSIRWGIMAFVACFSAAGLLQYVFDTQGAMLIMVVYGLSCALNQKVEPANAGT